ncbi:alpha/beta hydrolase [Clostridium sp. OS1-26]|uniref:alpha/beta hydrolase n=1 Tax=Clostridium sp. OS1-26 TaxID=3070681 RepID=UPI0027E19D84|nr:alpha/beta hydrolase [Clostridium sp. OS1-26]WML32581.1 alpha/beta hydrolase [Clostridium sp. OS1-26]
MLKDNPLKSITRNKFISLIKEYYNINEDCHHKVPYENGYLSSYHLSVKNPLGTLVIFGGFDSYIEELFRMALVFNNYGYDVICFDGPGQGSTLEDYNIPLTYQWERPVKAILDYFHLDDVTLIGLSLGGYLSLRAAAYEKRVKRVISDDICADFYQVILSQIDQAHRELFNTLMLNESSFEINSIFENLMTKNLMLKWAILQGMHITCSNTPYEFIKNMMSYKTAEISKLITQDVLLMAAQEDHYIPLCQFFEQNQTLTNVNSLTTRLFTRNEMAQNHCHIGNIQLSIDVITNWIQQTTSANYKVSV